ncbi:MAG: hypothetical protein KC422_17510 [Trueperaceae bacterium]|nr:hypothetical protein [Trueperaceae bacterium]
MSELVTPDCDMSMEARGDYLHVIAHGLDSAEVSLDICLAVSHEIAHTEIRKVLFEDYLDMQKAKHVDIIRFIQRVVLIRIPLTTKIAVVCKADKYGTNQFIVTTLSRLTPYTARVFTSKDEAEKWLETL